MKTLTVYKDGKFGTHICYNVWNYLQIKTIKLSVPARDFSITKFENGK